MRAERRMLRERVRRGALVLLAWGTLAPAAFAQAGRPAEAEGTARHVLAAGLGLSAGGLGGVYVQRVPEAAWLSWGIGAGIMGVAAHAQASLSRRPLGTGIAAGDQHRYLGVGLFALPWVLARSGSRRGGGVLLEGGVQYWPARGGRLYSDVGAGIVYRLWGLPTQGDFGVSVRLLVGGAP